MAERPLLKFLVWDAKWDKQSKRKVCDKNYLECSKFQKVYGSYTIAF